MKINNIDTVISYIFKISKKELSKYLGVEEDYFENIDPKQYKIKSALSGHNNQVYLIDFYDSKSNLLGGICLKYSFNEEMKSKLQLEAKILNTLRENKLSCPQVLCANFLDKFSCSYILMEVIEDQSVINTILNIKDAEKILKVIQKHELILSNNLDVFESIPSISLGLNQKIDFEKKLLEFLQEFLPHLIIRHPLDFLNQYLNKNSVLIKRKIITDRSAENILKHENNKITMIDFSTFRVGTEFDNWIQFIDDPKIKFSCSHEELVDLFLKKNNLSEEKDVFYVASIYTNLLQGIFTYKKNKKLGIDYISKVNESFEKFTNKKGLLIDAPLNI